MVRLFSKPSEAVIAHRSILYQVCDLIAHRAKHVAKHSRKGRYIFPVTTNELPEYYVTFCRENMAELLTLLSKQFPDTGVQYKPVAKGLDGRFYDVKTMENEDLQNVTYSIVLDWCSAAA